MGTLRRVMFIAAALALVATAPDAEAKGKKLEIAVNADVGQPVMIAGKKQRAYIKIGITGIVAAQAARAPVNVAMVIDRSGSMSGGRLGKARQAALMVVDRLGPQDIISVVAYDTNVEIVSPAARATPRNRQLIRSRIMELRTRDMTALYAGVSQGIEQVSENLSKDRVNRVILLSDGQANVGPSTPTELAALGTTAARAGVAITTIGLGLGYNEDLMARLALASDGNHAFARTGDDLLTIFNHELGDVLSVAAQDVWIEIEFAPGVRPIRGMNRALQLQGRKARVRLNQVYAKQEKNILVEVEVSPGAAGARRNLANVEVSYRGTRRKARGKVRSNVAVSFSGDRRKVEKSTRARVMADVTEVLVNERQKQAIALRDKGRKAEAKKVMRQNAKRLRAASRRYKSKKLKRFAKESDEAAESMDKNWGRARKSMRKKASSVDRSQAW